MFSALLQSVFSNLLYFALHLTNANSFPSPLSAEEESRLLNEMRAGSEEAEHLLIEHNLRLVAHIIKKYYSSYSEQEDLISIGTIGLIKAVKTFKPDKGTRLATYAARCVENEVRMYFRNQKKTAQDISMSEPIDTDSEGNPLTLTDIIYTNDTIFEDLDLKIKSEQLHKFISEMKNPRERAIIIMRYGLNNRPPLTQREVAEKMNISRSYVSRIEKKALLKLRKLFDSATDS